MMQRWISLFACVAIALFSQPAQAYRVEGAIWSNPTVPIYYQMPTASAALSNAIAAASEEWNGVSGFRYVPVSGSVDPCDSSQPVGVALAFTSCGDAFGSSTLAVTMYDTGGGRFKHAGIVFNQAKPFVVYNGPLQRVATDIQRVAAHELGHVLGLDHETTVSSLMAPNISSIYDPTDDDIGGIQALYGAPTYQTVLVSSILPASRSVQTGTTATAFTTIINTSSTPATGCSIALTTPGAAAFTFQATNPATNLPTGSPNLPVDIAGNATQSFTINITPITTVTATDLNFTMKCSNAKAVGTIPGVNTLLLSASSTPTPDIVALAATSQNDGYVHVGGDLGGAFAVATINLGASATIVASADTGTTVLPATISLCQTNPITAQCLAPPASSVTTSIASNATPTFSIFVTPTAAISPNPATKRVFVRFQDTSGITRGSTNVAVTGE